MQARGWYFAHHPISHYWPTSGVLPPASTTLVSVNKDAQPGTAAESVAERQADRLTAAKKDAASDYTNGVAKPEPKAAGAPRSSPFSSFRPLESLRALPQPALSLWGADSFSPPAT